MDFVNDLNTILLLVKNSVYLHVCEKNFVTELAQKLMNGVS